MRIDRKRDRDRERQRERDRRWGVEVPIDPGVLKNLVCCDASRRVDIEHLMDKVLQKATMRS